jgi:steroid delta-isomerase-like uncharacterized protein
MTRDEVLALCASWQDAFVRRDLDALAELYAEEAVIESPLAGTLSGRDAFALAHSAIFSAFPDIVNTFEPPLVGDDRAALMTESVGTNTGSLMGLSPTGRAFRLRLVFLLDFRDGRIVRDRRIYDFTGLLVQVGVVKAKPA